MDMGREGAAELPDEKTLQLPAGFGGPPVRGTEDMAALLLGEGLSGPGVTRAASAAPALSTMPGSKDASPPPTPLGPFADLGRYQLAGSIGRGGMGVVFRAHDRVLGRDVALKVLPSSHEVSNEAINRFEREARAAASLDHPNIIKVFDVGRLPASNGGHPFYTMELLTGETLAEAAHAGRLSTRETVEVTRQVALALSYAHQKGILHRDVKPQNVFLRGAGHATTIARDVTRADEGASVATRAVHGTEDVHALLLDFGLAKLTEGSLSSAGGEAEGTSGLAALTRSGEILGTPIYMAPEQVRSSKALDARADVYGLGASLYHALAKRPPFDEPTLAELLEAVRLHDPPAPRSIVPSLDADVETLCLKCLAKDPKDRYATAADLAEDCRRYLAGEPLAARPVGWIGRLVRKAKRYPSIAKLSVWLVVVALVALGFISKYLLVPWVTTYNATRHREQACREAEALLQEARRETSEEATEAKINQLLARYGSLREGGPVRTLCDAHLDLARMYDRRAAATQDRDAREKKFRDALVQLYRAYQGAVGSDWAAEMLVQIGDQLHEEMGEPGMAQGVYERTIEEGPAARDDFRARYGVARCLLEQMEFDRAAGKFAALAGDPHATKEEREEVAVCQGFLERTTPSVTIPVDFHRFTVADLDANGRPEIVAISSDGRHIVTDRVRDGDIAEVAPPCEVLAAGAGYELETIDALDVDGDGTLEVLAGGGTESTGTLAILHLEGAKLELWSSLDLRSSVRGHPFAAGDLHGDGRRQLIVGTSWNERHIRVYDWDARTRSASLECSIDAGGDLWTVLVRDANRNGLGEIWAFAGPWTAYSIQCWEWDAAKRAFARKSSVPFVREAVLATGAGSDGDSVLVGAEWSTDSLQALANDLGWQPVQEEFRRPGAYEVRFRPDLTVEAVPLLELPWDMELMQGCNVCRLDREVDRYALAATIPTRGSDRFDAGDAFLDLCWKDGDRWQKIARMRPRDAGEVQPRAFDIDGDGRMELVFCQVTLEGGADQHNLLRICGLGSAPRPAPLEDRRPHGSGGRALAGDVSSSLVSAREAEQIGLAEEAASDYRRTVRESTREEEVREAVLGETRCLVRSGEHAEAADRSDRRAREFPRLAPAIRRTTLEEMDAHGQWAHALAAEEKDSATLSLEYAPHQGVVRGSVEVAASDRGGSMSIRDIHLVDDHLLLGILARGIMSAAAEWGEFEVRDWRLDGGGRSLRVVPYQARRAVDLVFLANGRWMNGKKEDALELYRKAIEAGDTEVSSHALLASRGLRNESQEPWAEAYVSSAGIDARFWRGLLHAALGHGRDSSSDLEEAWRRSPERCLRLVRDSSFALRTRPLESAAIRALLAKEWQVEAKDLDALVFRACREKALEGSEVEVARGLVWSMGFDLRFGVVVTHADEASGVKEGDVLLRWDGAAFEDLATLHAAQRKAREERREVPVVLQRGNGRVESRLGPGTGVGFGQALMGVGRRAR